MKNAFLQVDCLCPLEFSEAAILKCFIFIGVFSIWNLQRFPKEGAQGNIQCLARVEDNIKKKPQPTNQMKKN